MSDKRKRVLIVNDEMVVGGVARVLNNMLSEIGDLDCDIDILILHPHGEMMKDIPEGYKILKSTPFFEVCDLPLRDALASGNIGTIIRKAVFFFLMKTGLIHRFIKKERKKIIKEPYDVEVAYKEGFCTVFVADGDSRKKINWIHVDYENSNYSKNHMALVKDALSRIDVNVAVSKDAGEAYKRVFDLKEDCRVINNFIDEELIEKKSREEYSYPTDVFNIVTVGRLHPQKANLRMMEVCRRLNDDGLKYDFYIVGDGEERNEIEAKIKEYGLSNVHLIGYDPNPYKYIKNCDLFLLPSLYEGVPTVVYETLSIGNIPIVSTKVSGISEQLGDNEYGIIIENNEDAIYQKLKEIIEDPSVLDVYRRNKKELTNNKVAKKKIDELFTG
ncbi:MAG: glycosyltransferase [Erysipelotrichaceae bacterium]|nr:glycosyltransferase [Erysipelotrichaceae bacterium]